MERCARKTCRWRPSDGASPAAPTPCHDASVVIEIADPEVVAASGATLHPMVVETGDPADEVAGTLFLVTETELAAADAYEVSAYRRIQVLLKSGKSAWVYVKA